MRNHEIDVSFPQISEAELAVMRVLWRRAPLGAAEIVTQLAHPDWSSRTVKTLLSRLVAKGALTFTEQANRYLYSPAIPQEPYLNQEGRKFADRVLDGKVFPMLVHFLSHSRLDPSEIAELRKMLDDQEKQP